jgi:hypothetical protein
MKNEFYRKVEEVKEGKEVKREGQGGREQLVINN